jgi:hypothetical protein
MPEAPTREVKASGGSALLVRYVTADKEVRAMEEKLEAAKKKLNELEPQVLDYMQRHGMSSAKVAGLTVYLNRQIWASVAKDEAGDNTSSIETLKQFPDTSVFVKEGVNTQTLSAWVREQPQDSQFMPLLPEEVVGAIKVTEKYNVRTRKS